MRFCGKHRQASHVDLKNALCVYPGCRTLASYGPRVSLSPLSSQCPPFLIWESLGLTVVMWMRVAVLSFAAPDHALTFKLAALSAQPWSTLKRSRVRSNTHMIAHAMIDTCPRTGAHAIIHAAAQAHTQ